MQWILCTHHSLACRTLAFPATLFRCFRINPAVLFFVLDSEDFALYLFPLTLKLLCEGLCPRPGSQLEAQGSPGTTECFHLFVSLICS